MSFKPEQQRVFLVHHKFCLKVDFSKIFGFESDSQFFFFISGQPKLRWAGSELTQVRALDQNFTVRQILDPDFFLDSEAQAADAILKPSLGKDNSGASANRDHFQGFGDLFVFF